MEHLARNNVETRRFFLGMHRQPALIKYGCDGSGNYPVTDGLTGTGMYLPSGSGLTGEQIRHICRLIGEFKR